MDPSPVPFDLFGTAHIVVMALSVAVPVALSLIVRRAKSEAVTRGVCVGFAAVLAANQIVYWAFRWMTDGTVTFMREHLPLHLCSVGIILAVIVLLTRGRLAYELIYFWGLAGTTNAIVTPELAEGWPDYLFIQFFISHGGIVGAALFATWGLRMRPTFKSLIRAFLWLNALAAGVAVVNLLLDSNYMYLCAPPDTASPFLLFPWPWYLLWLEVFAFFLFALLYLPVWLASGRGKARGKAGGAIAAPVLAAVLLGGCVAYEDPVAFTGTATVAVEPPSVRLSFLGQTRGFRATVRNPFGEEIGRPVEWSSSDPSVITVDAAGVVTAVANGVAQVRASAEGVTGTAAVTVERLPATLAIVSGGDQVGVRGTTLPEPIRVRVVDEGGLALAGATVLFTPDRKDGLASPGGAETDARGEASTLWTLGEALGPQSLVIATGRRVRSDVAASAIPETPLSDLGIVGDIRLPEDDRTTLEPVPVTVRVANVGNAPTPPTFPLTVSVGDTAVATFEIDGIDAGDTVEVTREIGPLDVGYHAMEVVLDEGEAIEEWFENNNRAWTRVRILRQGRLAVGDSVTVSSAFADTVRLFRVDVAEPAPEALTFRLSGASGDPDLFVHFGERPGYHYRYECQSGNVGANELCRMVPTRAGTYNVAVHAFKAFPSTVLTVTTGEPFESFDIDVVFTSPLSASQRAVAREAIRLWESVIARGAEDVDFGADTLHAGGCHPGSAPVTTVVDDLLVFVGARPIDGPGGILALSGPCSSREFRLTDDHVIPRETVVGSIAVDSHDLDRLEDDGFLGATVSHQMAHVLGFGLRRHWGITDMFGSAPSPGSPDPDQYFAGPWRSRPSMRPAAPATSGPARCPSRPASTGREACSATSSWFRCCERGIRRSA